MAAGPGSDMLVAFPESLEDLTDRRGGLSSRNPLDRLAVQDLGEQLLGLGLRESEVGMPGREDATLPLVLDPERIGCPLTPLEQQISSPAKPERRTRLIGFTHFRDAIPDARNTGWMGES